MIKQQLSERGLEFIARHEGLRSCLYKGPAGISTIGYGFTWQSAGFREWWRRNDPSLRFENGCSMTREEATKCLRDIFEGEHVKAVRKFYGNDSIQQCVFDASVSVVYNCGPRALKWKWAAYAREGKRTSAGMRLEKTATTAKGVKLKVLVERRREESLLLQTGNYGDGLPNCRYEVSPPPDTGSPDAPFSARGLFIRLFGLG